MNDVAITLISNIPAAPHLGEVFESTINRAKKALKVILGDVEITDEE